MTKSNSPLVSLGRQWVPIFADPDRDYQYLAECHSYRRTRTGLRLNALTNEGEPVTVTLAFVTPEVLRVQAFLSEPPPRRTPMLLEKRRPPVPFEVTVNKEAITLKSSALRAVVRRRPWRISVEDASGKMVYQQQVQDRAIVFHMSLPPGFSRDAQGRIAFHECFSLAPDEHLFGLGQHYGPLDKRGQRHVAWTRDAYGTNTTDITYHNTPFFMSSRGYGIFVNQTSRSVYELGLPSAETGAFRVEDPYLDYFLIYGPGPKDILARYTDLTGRAPVPPLWSFGVWTSRCMYRDRQQVEEVVAQYRQLGIPLDVAHLDALWLKERKKHLLDACDFIWDDEAFPDEEGFIQWLAERGVKLSLWENPYIYRDTPTYRQALRRGYLVLLPDGTPASSSTTATPPSSTSPTPAPIAGGSASTSPTCAWGPPPSRPTTARQCPRRRSSATAAAASRRTTSTPCSTTRPPSRSSSARGARLSSSGAPATPAPSATPSTGWATASAPGTAWPEPCAAASASASPASHSGATTSAASSTPTTSSSRIPLSTSAGLNGASSHRTPDSTGSVRGSPGTSARRPSRWCASSPASDTASCPISMPSPTRPTRPACPWSGPSGWSILNDPHTPYIDRQYLLGPSLLVAPVFNEEGRCNVYLPPGRWYDWWDGTVVEGPRYLSASDGSVPIERLPLFVRGDSLLPLAPVMDHVGQREWEPIELQVRVQNEARLRFFDPQHPIEVKAQRRGNEVEVSLRVEAPRKLEIRLIEPTPARSVAFEGKVEDANWENTPQGAVARLRALGRCSLRASFGPTHQ